MTPHTQNETHRRYIDGDESFFDEAAAAFAQQQKPASPWEAVLTTVCVALFFALAILWPEMGA